MDDKKKDSKKREKKVKKAKSEEETEVKTTAKSKTSVKNKPKKAGKSKAEVKKTSKAKTTREKAKAEKKTSQKVKDKTEIKTRKTDKKDEAKAKKDIKAATSEEASKQSRTKLDWEEAKRLSIKSVIDKELDKEEKEGRLRAKLIQKRKAAPVGKGKTARALKEERTGQKEKVKKRPEIKKVIEISEGITIKELSEKVNIPSNEMIKLLFDMGEAININQSLSKDLIEYLSHEYNFKYHIVGFEEKLDEVYKDDEKDLKPRPPIVTVMGHVDHGKTTLLDAIRETSVAVSEVGGITQRIGAYQVEYKKKKITFIDTPGHEAFTSIRARGARVTDIAVIVVAADDGIMPQTVEAMDHAKDAGVPIIIAINKIDLSNANPDKVKQGLTEHNLVPEEWGGDAVCVEISAKKRTNLDELLEMILLVTDVNEIRGNPESEGAGIIIESRLDKGLGPVGTVVVKRGTIKVGDSFITGNSLGRIRSIRDENGRNIRKAVLSQPVEVTGFSSSPKAGDKLFIVKNEKAAKELQSRKDYEKKMMMIAESRKSMSLEELYELSKETEIKTLKIILKADSNGSLDAVEKSLNQIEEEKIKIDIIHKAIGAIKESDVMLAAASNAIIIGFGVVPTQKADDLYKKEKVEVRTYDVIYKLIDDIKLAFKGMLEPEVKKVDKGKAEVREIFKLPKTGVIAGSYILEGEVERGDQVNVIRDSKVIHEGKIATLHRFKEDVKKVTSGYECGIRLEEYQDLAKGDILEFYVIK